MISSILKAPFRALQKYNQALLKSPYKTKMMTAGTTYFIADNICQHYIEKKTVQDHSFVRSCRQSSVGAFFAAPSLHVWHSKILPTIVKPIVGRFKTVLLAVLLNETVLAGYFVSCLLFSFEALRALDADAGVRNVKEKFSSAMVTSMKFWTGISFINYGLMPVHLRPVFVSCWSIVWQSYLSYVSNNNLKVIENKAKEISVEKEESFQLQPNQLRLLWKASLFNYFNYLHTLTYRYFTTLSLFLFWILAPQRSRLFILIFQVNYWRIRWLVSALW